MNVEKHTKHGATVTLTAEELVILNNALNEVVNGVKFDEDEFLTRLGVRREQARGLLEKVGELLGRLK